MASSLSSGEGANPGAPRVAIVGRPNVGKSTLFNRLVGRRRAIVDDTPGVTRDVREQLAQLGDLQFNLLDTAGWETAGGEVLEARMRRFTERAIDASDVVVFMIDARSGVLPLDEAFANWLRKRADKVILVANKCEGRAGANGLAEAHGLGLGEPIPISAEHAEGLSDLHEALARFIPPMAEEDDEDDKAEKAALAKKEGIGPADAPIDETPDRPLLLAIVGRPNVGKSTLLNRIVGEERVLTGPEAGITRDAIRVEWAWKGRAIRLVDTAGMRRRSRIDARLEQASVADTLDTIRLADVVIVVLDAADMLEKQDLTIAGRVIDEGRALVVVVNKIDLLAEDRSGASKAWRKLRDRLQASFAQVKDVPIVGLSALNGRGLEKLMPAVFDIYGVWNKRIKTNQINRWLREMETLHPPPLAKGRRIRLRFMSQIKTRPPSFILSCSQPSELGDDYLRFLINRLRDDFDFPGVPIRLTMRKPDNPFASRAKKQR
jgi:GTPase